MGLFALCSCREAVKGRICGDRYGTYESLFVVFLLFEAKEWKSGVFQRLNAPPADYNPHFVIVNLNHFSFSAFSFQHKRSIQIIVQKPGMLNELTVYRLLYFLSNIKYLKYILLFWVFLLLLVFLITVLNYILTLKFFSCLSYLLWVIWLLFLRVTHFLYYCYLTWVSICLPHLKVWGVVGLYVC